MSNEKKPNNPFQFVDDSINIKIDNFKYPVENCIYVTDDDFDNFMNDADGFLIRIRSIDNKMKPICGTIEAGGYRLLPPTNELFHAIYCTEDVSGWKNHIKFAAKQFGLLTAEILDNKIILSDGRSYELSACRFETYPILSLLEKNLSLYEKPEVNLKRIDKFTLEIRNKDLIKYRIAFETKINHFFVTDDSVYSVILTKPISDTSTEANIFCVLNASGKIIWKKGPTPNPRPCNFFDQIRRISETNSEFLGWYCNGYGEVIDMATGKTLHDDFTL
jgi:hypothetical protein